MDEPAQLDEPCAVAGDLGAGIDDCDSGLYCWDYDAEGHGTCSAFCFGVHGDPKCPQKMECAAIAEAALDLCVRSCNPLMPDCPAVNGVCIPHGHDPGVGDFFSCRNQYLDEIHTGELNSPCYYASSCGNGLVCLHDEAAVECNDVACCQPVCDTEAPNTCPGQGQECVAWYPPDLAPPGQENVGVCTIPG
jgi:hypothetical protein